jgi:hypothetical protein
MKLMEQEMITLRISKTTECRQLIQTTRLQQNILRFILSRFDNKSDGQS